MGKRSSFNRQPRDFYPTPLQAVIPLFAHLPPAFAYVEPCAGDGALCRAVGRDPVFACDINPQWDQAKAADALRITESQMHGANFIITNPPWDRKMLHPMIDHFSRLRPTWLLFDADWVHTTQKIVAKKYGVKTVPELMQHCRKIVSVGRVKWIPDSKMTGKDNCAWYLFDQTGVYSGPTIFHARTETFTPPNKP
jgi:hypothetical protein